MFARTCKIERRSRELWLPSTRWGAARLLTTAVQGSALLERRWQHASMNSGRDSGWRQHLIEARGAVAQGASAELYRSAAAGTVVRIAPGVFLPSEVWQSLDPDDRFRARIDAAAIRFGDAGPFSHLSAAAMWGLPNVTPWPARAEVLAAHETGGRSRRGLVRHAVGIPSDGEVIDGHRVTSLARTVVDAASALPFTGGVAMTDFVLRAASRGEAGVAAARASHAELQRVVAERGSLRGGAKARRAVEFADGRSGSPGESLSRCAMLTSGIPSPQLQTRFSDAMGLIGYVDFWWPEWGVIGEFDGRGKYLREDLRNGKTTAEVIVDEKVREDRLRAATGARVVRWGWDVARSPQLLATALLRAGLPLRRRFS